MSIVFGTQKSAAEQNFIMVYLVNNGCGTRKKFPRAYASTFWNPPFLNPRSAPATAQVGTVSSVQQTTLNVYECIDPLPYLYGSSAVLCTLCSVLAGNFCKVFSLSPVLVTMFLCSTCKHLEMKQVLIKMYPRPYCSQETWRVGSLCTKRGPSFV